MPIDTSKSHGAIVKELVANYKKTGYIGSNKPKNLEHAVRMANAIAYRAKEEAVLLKIEELNRSEAIQLSLDVKKNVDNYLNSIVKTNENELAILVKSFIQDYSSAERSRLRSFGVNQPYSLKEEYSTQNLVFLDIEEHKIPIGYRQKLDYLTQSVAEKVLKQTNHFRSKLSDSTLFIEITSSYLAEIRLAVSDLLG